MCLTSPQEIMHLWSMNGDCKRNRFRCHPESLVPCPWIWRWKMFLPMTWAMMSAWTIHSSSSLKAMDRPKSPDWMPTMARLTRSSIDGPRQWKIALHCFRILYCKLLHLRKFRITKNNNQLSRIEYSDDYSTTSTIFSTGNTPKNIVTHSCYMAETVDPNLRVIAEKGGEIVFSTALFQIRIWHQLP